MRIPPPARLLIALLAIALLGTLPAAQAQPAADAKPLRVLFIGNSYTSVNNLPAMVQSLAVAAKENRKFEFVAVTPGGYSFQQHHDQDKSQALARIAEGGWDFVVLQEQSQMPFMYPKTTLNYGAKLGELIKAQKATPLLYLTWARENQPENQAALTKTYTELAKTLNAPIAPVGVAWEAAREQRKNLALYQKDQSHPSAPGSYLAACVFYATFYDKSPQNLPNRVMIGEPGKQRLLAEIKKEDAAFLQKVAWDTVQSNRPKKE